MFLLALLACGTISPGDPPGGDSVGGADSGVAEDTGDTTTPDDDYIADEDPVTPSLTLAEVATALTEALATTEAVDAVSLFDQYDQVLGQSSASCPYVNADYLQYDVTYWYDDCTAASGASFAGYGYGYHFPDYYTDAYTYFYDYGYWFGDAVLTRNDGYAMSMSGSASIYHYTHTYYGYSYRSFSLQGEFHADMPEQANTWLGQGVSVSLDGARFWYGDDLGSMQINGGISHLEGAVNAVVYDHLNMTSAQQGSQCTDEPGGTISLRDATGEWYDVVFQGPQAGSTTSFPADCDGCGVVWFRGDNLGVVCPDLSTLATWGS